MNFQSINSLANSRNSFNLMKLGIVGLLLIWAITSHIEFYQNQIRNIKKIHLWNIGNIILLWIFWSICSRRYSNCVSIIKNWYIFQFISKINFWHFVVLRRDLLSETEVLQTANEYKSGSYDPEIYRFPNYNIKELLDTDTDVTNQLLNSPLALATPGMTKNLKSD